MSKWDKVRIKQAFSYVSRGKSPNYTEMSTTRVINQACIYWDGLHLEKVKYQDSTMVNADRYLNNNDVLINSTGTGTLGRCCVFTSNANDINYIADSHVTVLRPSDDICASFFKYFIMRKETQECIYSKCVNGSTNQIELSKEKLLKFLIPVPPLETQKQIAKTLDTAAELLAMHKQQLAELDNLIKSTFYDMFGEPVTNEMRWDIVRLHEVAIKITDGTHQSPRFIDNGIPFLFVSNIVDNKINYFTEKFISEEEYKRLIARTPIEVGDILYTIVGSYGNPAIVQDLRKFCFQRHIAYIKPKRESINSTYLFGALLSDHVISQVEKRVRGVAQKTLNLSELKEIEIPLPPIPLQNQFAEIVTKIEEQKTLVKKAIGETQYLFDSLMSEYFEED